VPPFEQMPICIRVRLMPNRQRLLGGVDRGTHVFADPFFAYVPGFV
jgi:hypothetical protein